MKSILLLLFTAVLLIPLTSQAQDRDDWDSETMIDETFSVSTGGTLEVEVGDADVMVEPGSSNEVHVEVVVQARDLERGIEYYERQNFSVDQRGNTVRVETDPGRRIEWNWRTWRDHPHIYVRVTVPETFNADLRTADGDIAVDRLKGELRLKTSDGDVTAGELSGDALTLGTSDGDIRIDALGGDAEVKTSDGDIDVSSFNGQSLFARTSDGDIDVSELIAETSTVHSSDGEITLRRVEGDLKVTGSSASIRLELRNPGQIEASSSDGDITITMPESHRADVRLRGDDVRISSSLDFDGRLEENRAEGTINGGGPLLEARTSDGDVTLRGN